MDSGGEKKKHVSGGGETYMLVLMVRHMLAVRHLQVSLHHPLVFLLLLPTCVVSPPKPMCVSLPPTPKYDIQLPKLKSNGIIIADNVLWSGNVIDADKIRNDRLTKNMHDFNEFIKKDSRVSKIILPIRDGITLIKKND